MLTQLSVRLNERFTLSQIAALFSDKTSLSGRVKLESSMSHPLRFKHVLLQKYRADLYQSFKSSLPNIFISVFEENDHNFWPWVYYRPVCLELDQDPDSI